MGEVARRTLEERVAGPLPSGIAALPSAKKQLLADALGDARRSQGQELAEAANAALQYVPKLLRGPVRKVVGL